MGRTLSAFVLPAAMAIAHAATAAEIKIGEPVEKVGLQIAAVYLQAVTMEPHHTRHDHTDIHLEADVKALKGNNYGFGAGEWVAYLDIDYTITKEGSTYVAKGKLLPMVASDGPHYGDNIKLDGAGKYHVVYRITAAAHGFLRHTDKETGVGKWWEPFAAEWDFTYVGSTGKKGTY